MKTNPRELRDFLAVLTFGLLLAVIPSHAQTFTVLHTFDGAPSDGEEPLGALIRDSAGNLYGTTGEGGNGGCATLGCGTIFMLNEAGTLVALYSFDGKNGQFPVAGLFRDSAGNFYGTAEEGGDDPPACRGVGGCGVAFELTKTGKERTYKFQGAPNGLAPTSPLVRDAGNFFGTTTFGGSYGYGTIFKIDTQGNETVLHSFTGGSDGCFPDGVIVRNAGQLYGATHYGGIGFCNSGFGTVYKLDQSGNLTVLQTFDEDGWYPSVSIIDSAGNLYGETQQGGTGGCPTGCGTLFELSPQGNGIWRQTMEFEFCSLPNCADGAGPGPVVMDTAGNLYGITYGGGAYPNCNGNGCGVVYELNTSGEETVLYSFTGGSDGAVPVGGLALDTSGNLYGVAEEGGNAGCNPPSGCGVVFKITP
jgi:uncharacterized repeat protein (TIGR03803 family)